jgi:4-aminobutyrate aminotransferase-like enzyme
VKFKINFGFKDDCLIAGVSGVGVSGQRRCIAAVHFCRAFIRTDIVGIYGSFHGCTIYRCDARIGRINIYRTRGRQIGTKATDLVGLSTLVTVIRGSGVCIAIALRETVSDRWTKRATIRVCIGICIGISIGVSVP